MKKKLAIISLLSFAVFGFSSCTNTVNDKNIADEISDIGEDTLAYLNATFNNENDGVVFNKDTQGSKKKHYEIYLSNKGEESLFKVRNDITDVLKNKKDNLKKVSSKPLQFTNSKISKSSDLLDEMLDNVEDQLFDDEYGLSQFFINDDNNTQKELKKLSNQNSETATETEIGTETETTTEQTNPDNNVSNVIFNVDFEIDMDGDTLYPEIKTTNLYDYYKGLENKENIYLNTVYLPLVVYKLKGASNLYLRRYVFVPIYLEITNESMSASIDSKGKEKPCLTKDIAEKELVFKNAKKGYLALKQTSDNSQGTSTTTDNLE